MEIIGIYISGAENRKALIRGKEFVNEPRDPAKVRFTRLEQVENINHNVNLLMETLNSKLGIFGEEGDLNVEEKSEGGSGDREDTENQPKKEPKKYQPILSVMNQSLFKTEEKVDIKSYHGEIHALNSNHFLQRLEFYFNLH